VTNGPTEPQFVAESRRDAWATLYTQYSVRVWRYVARIIGADSDAVADAVQETFLAAARNFEQFDPERGSTWAWLTGIAHRQAALHWRRVGRDRIDPAGPSVEAASTEDSTTSPLEQAESVNIVRRVLAELPSDSAAVLAGKYCDGNSVAELVEQFGGTTEGVRSKLARARRDFKNRYEKACGNVTSQEPLKTLDPEPT
jgi:RNA polymerase sigma-70 factor, ECF subfamily